VHLEFRPSTFIFDCFIVVMPGNVVNTCLRHVASNNPDAPLPGF
jgi:hypothetical protein